MHPGAMDSAVSSMEAKGVKLLTNYALSLVVSGHSGVRAFLPTFIMALIACVAPDYVSLSSSPTSASRDPSFFSRCSSQGGDTTRRSCCMIFSPSSPMNW